MLASELMLSSDSTLQASCHLSLANRRNLAIGKMEWTKYVHIPADRSPPVLASLSGCINKVCSCVWPYGEKCVSPWPWP
jgi:hypothetical protein